MYYYDGYSGTNYEHLAFGQLIKDIRNSETSTLSAKDQLRLRMFIFMFRYATEKDTKELAKQALLIDSSKVTVKKALFMVKTNIFSGYLLEELLELAQSCRLVDYQMGDTIIEEQTKIESLYVICEGRVEVSRTNKKNYSQPLEVLREKDVFGLEYRISPVLAEWRL